MTKNHLLSGLLLANVLSVLAFLLFFQMIQRRLGKDTALKASVLMLAFPGAFFFYLPYTESIYALMALAWLDALEREEYFWLSLIGFLLPLTRPVGVFVLAPLVWHLYEKRKPRKFFLLPLSPIVGYGVYFALMYLWTGNPLEGFEAQRKYPNTPSIENMVNATGFLNAFASVSSLHEMLDSVVDRALFIVFVFSLPLVYRLDKTWFWYALPTGLVPALTSYFISYRRYIMVCFPVFIVLALLLTKSRERWLFWYFVGLLAVLQGWAIFRFVHSSWAG